MSSYADIAAENAPPQSQQPKPDPGYLEGHNGSEDVNPAAPDVDSGKINVVPSDADLEHLKTQSQEAYEEAVAKARAQRSQLEADAKKASDSAKQTANEATKAGKDAADQASKKGQQAADEAEKLGKNARAEAEKTGQKAGEYLEKGKKELSKDAEVLRKKGEEGAKKLRKKAGEAEKEVESFWNKFSSDPKQWGPALAAVNVALLGGLGVYAYTHQDEVRRTDRRSISAAAVGILSLLGVQGYWANETAKKQNSSFF